MPIQIQPVIATVAQVRDYCGITVAQGALPLNSGTTLNAFIQTLLDRTAWRITKFLEYDYTPAQVEVFRGYGNNQQFFDFPFPINTITAFTSFDPSDPKNNTVVNIGAAALSPKDTGNPYRLYRIDGQSFLPGLEYYIAMTTAPDVQYPPTWPLDVVQSHCEMVASILKESGNSGNALNELEHESATGRPIKYDKKVMDKIFRQLRPYKHFAI